MKSILSLGSLALVNVILLFLIHWFILVTIGPGEETDAFFAGMAVPQLILAILSASLMQILVPLLAVQEGEDFHRNTWGFFVFVGGGLSVLALILYLLGPFWVPFFVPGFSAAGKELMLDLTRIQLIGMIFTALSSVLWAVYHSRKYFLWVAFVPVFTNAAGLGLLIWALPRYGIRSAAWVSVLAVVLQTLLLLPVLGIYRKPNWKSNIYREAWIQIKPLLLGTSYYKTDSLIDRFLSSMGPVGGLSLFYLGQQVYGAVNQVINKSIVAPMVPLLAEHANNGNWSEFRRTYRERLFWIIGITGGGYLLFLLFGNSLLRLVLVSREVSEQDLSLLWWIMISLVGAFIGGAAGQITSAAFYTKGDTETPTKLGVWTYTFYIPIKILFFWKYSLIGLAVSTTLFVTVNCLLQIYVLGKFSPERRRMSPT
ncbi:hypothetical protein MNBD_NITROSPIRAE01-842 [hydrothermal vent metagenome]|uniref:Virulence factor MviN n=1 Tax=hydrothermal vent metagenome TaxID=652676 RepID=A0A3B1CK79_9ZZZZ